MRDPEEPIRLGVSFGRAADGWWAYVGGRRRFGRQCRSMHGGTLWDVVKFFVVPTRYYVWRYERQQRASSS